MEHDILVLMSAYNGEKYIKEQIDSILAQKGCNVKLIIRDDGSTDNTVNIINEYAYKYENISVINDGINLGAANSFFRLLYDSPNCEFYAFADQDDIWDSDKLITGINKISDYTTPALYVCNARLVDSQGLSFNVLEHTEREIYMNAETVLCINQFLGCTMVFNDALAQLIKTVEFPNSVIMHDYYLSSACVLCGGSIIYDPEPHMSYRQHGNNVMGISLDFKTKMYKKISYIFSKKKIYVYMQITDLLERYEPYMSDSLKKFADYLKNTDNSFKARLIIALSSEVHYANLNQAVTYRCAYLLGNK